MALNHRSTRLRTLATSAGIALTALAVTGAPASAASCNPPRYPGSGYFTSKIRTTKVSCTSYGRSFVVRHYRCRTRNGKSLRGTCPRLSRFRCSERRASIEVEFDSRVTCRRGAQRIVFTYQQRIE